MQPRYIAGVDAGSLYSKAVILAEDGSLAASAIIRSGGVYVQAVKDVLDMAIKNAGLSEVSVIVATGYGRARVPFADHQISEISCHGRAVHHFFPDVGTVIDIGGQDTKVIYIDEHGGVSSFIMNDKCAAGCGRFLEVMATTLDLNLGEMGALSLRSTQPHEITSMCTVFAESEVISLKANGCEVADIAAAIHASMARRVSGLVARYGIRKQVAMSGGVAQDVGMVRALERQLRTTLLIPENCQFMGAYGAALTGVSRMLKGAAT